MRNPRMEVYCPYRVGDEVMVIGKYHGEITAIVLKPWLSLRVRYTVVGIRHCDTHEYESEISPLDLELIHHAASDPDPVPSDRPGSGS